MVFEWIALGTMNVVKEIPVHHGERFSQPESNSQLCENIRVYFKADRLHSDKVVASFTQDVHAIFR